MKAYVLTMEESEIAWVSGGCCYFKPDIVFDVNSMQFVPNRDGTLFAGCEFTKGLYGVTLIKLGDALAPACNTAADRIDLDVVTLGVKSEN